MLPLSAFSPCEPLQSAPHTALDKEELNYINRVRERNTQGEQERARRKRGKLSSTSVDVHPI